MSGERLILVEDEQSLAEVIADNLVFEGYDVRVVHDGSEGLELIRADTPDLVLLDVMLPGMNGFDVCAALRREKNDVPILFLTARCTDDDRVRGLELGGDDFLGKPFDLRELILRVRAILKRTQWYSEATRSEKQLVLGDLAVDFEGFALRHTGATTGSGSGERPTGSAGSAAKNTQEIQLSSKETMILRCLFDHVGEVVSRDDILDRVWGYDAFPTTRSIDNFIVRLRRLIEPDPKNPRYIHTIRGVGYRLTP